MDCELGDLDGHFSLTVVDFIFIDVVEIIIRWTVVCGTEWCVAASVVIFRSFESWLMLC